MLSAVCLLSVLDLIKKYVVDRGGQGFSGSNEDRIGDLKNSAFGENLKALSFFNLEN